MHARSALFRTPSTSRSIAPPFRLHPLGRNEKSRIARACQRISVSVCVVSLNLRLNESFGAVSEPFRRQTCENHCCLNALHMMSLLAFSPHSFPDGNNTWLGDDVNFRLAIALNLVFGTEALPSIN